MFHPHIELDLDVASELALRFREARAAKLRSIHKVAKDLLLSQMQVLGLESASSKSFYNARIYAQAARKYCSYLEIDFDVDQLLIYPRPYGDPPAVTSGVAISRDEEAANSRGELERQSTPRGALLCSGSFWMIVSALLAVALLYTQRSALEALVPDGVRHALFQVGVARNEEALRAPPESGAVPLEDRSLADTSFGAPMPVVEDGQPAAVPSASIPIR